MSEAAPRLNKFYRLRQVEEYAGLKRTAIDEMVKAGEFPRPIPLNDSGRAVGWLECELIEWQLSRIAKRRG